MDKALEKSQNNTTFEEQKARITNSQQVNTNQTNSKDEFLQS